MAAAALVRFGARVDKRQAKPEFPGRDPERAGGDRDFVAALAAHVALDQ